MLVYRRRRSIRLRHVVAVLALGGCLVATGPVQATATGRQRAASDRVVAAEESAALVHRIRLLSGRVVTWQGRTEIQALVEGPEEALAPEGYNRRGQLADVAEINSAMKRLDRRELPLRERSRIDSLVTTWRACRARDGDLVRLIERVGASRPEVTVAFMEGPVRESWDILFEEAAGLETSLDRWIARQSVTARRAQAVSRFTPPARGLLVLALLAIAAGGLSGRRSRGRSSGGLRAPGGRSPQRLWRAGFRPLPRARRATT